MVMTTEKKPLFEQPTKPVEMKRNCVAAKRPRRIGDIVEVAEKEYRFLTETGAAIPHLGEPVAKKRSTRRKKSAGK
jgi:hypothetical protein